MKKQILKPRKTGEQRRRNYKVSIGKRIKRYIKNGGKGNLDLWGSPVENLPDNLKVGGSLNLRNTPLSKTYSKEEIRSMIEEKGGYVKGVILL